jgi:hypothetical protein
MISSKTSHAGEAELVAKHLNGRLNSLTTAASRVLERSSMTRLVTYWITKKLDH